MKNILLLFIFFFIYGWNVFAEKTFVFIGSYNFDKTKEGIYVYELNTITGNLSKVTSAKDVLNPGYLLLSQNGTFLYSCTDAKTPKAGSVSSYKFNPSEKSLTFINSRQTGGENPVYVSLSKSENYLLSANYTDGSVTVYPIQQDGSIATANQIIRYSDGSINKTRQEHSHIHSTVFSPDGNYVFLPDLGGDRIWCYAFDSLQAPVLKDSKNPITFTVPGSGPRHFTFHPNGKFAYCIEELSGTISVYHYENGKLDSIQRIATHPKKYQAEFSSADIHISPDGKFLYATNRGEENNIAIFSIQENGILQFVAYQSTLGKTPRNFCIDATGKFLIVANQSTGNIIVFKRNKKTGLLKKTGKKIKVENPTCVQIKYYPEK